MPALASQYQPRRVTKNTHTEKKVTLEEGCISLQLLADTEHNVVYRNVAATDAGPQL